MDELNEILNLISVKNWKRGESYYTSCKTCINQLDRYDYYWIVDNEEPYCDNCKSRIVINKLSEILSYIKREHPELILEAMNN